MSELNQQLYLMAKSGFYCEIDYDGRMELGVVKPIYRVTVEPKINIDSLEG